jgi:hypothetical protein
LVKFSASEVYATFHKLKQNPIEKPSQSARDRTKDLIYQELKEQYENGTINFEEFFEKVAYHIIFPYGEDENVNDEDSEDDDFELDDDYDLCLPQSSSNKKRFEQKIVFENSLESIDFEHRLDFSNMVIKGQTVQSSQLKDRRLRLKFSQTKNSIHAAI